MNVRALFSGLYQYALDKAEHPRALHWLALFTVVEAVIFPIPVIVMLMPMILAQPKRAWWLATFTVAFSVIGAVVGYGLGAFAFDWLLHDFFMNMGYMHYFDQVSEWFHQYGIFCILAGSIVPIPFKVFTVAAGVVGMPFLPFILGCLISRSLRYYLVAAFCYFGKNHIETFMVRYMDRMGWLFIGCGLMLWWVWPK